MFRKTRDRHANLFVKREISFSYLVGTMYVVPTRPCQSRENGVAFDYCNYRLVFDKRLIDSDFVIVGG